MKGILGRKVGMTQVFSKDGKLIPVTVVSVPANTVMQIKTKDTDGYDAIQLGVVDKKEKNASRASVGHAKKANTTPKRFLKEIRDCEGNYQVGDQISADTFEVGDIVDVTLDIEEFIKLADIKNIGIPIFIAHGKQTDINEIMNKLKAIKRNNILRIKYYILCDIITNHQQR